MAKVLTITEMATGNWFTNIFTPKQKPEARSYYRQVGSFTMSYDGEKNLGEIGQARQYFLDYDILRVRSWQSYLESEITQMVIKKFAMWVVGGGLKLQSEPNIPLLNSEGITVDFDTFSNLTEAKFNQFCKSKYATYNNQKTFNKLAKTAFINAIIGGDVLIIQRVINGQVKIQLLDGCHVQSPLHGNDLYAAALKNGNVIRHGIEMNANGEHIAYYIRTKDYKFERIKAKSANGQVMAFLLYGSEYRLDNHRGMPLIAAVLETLKKLERYKEATVGSAEERQKIVMQIVHQLGSTGENPLAKQMAKAFNADYSSDEIPEDINGRQLADTVAASTNKQVFNMPVNSKLEGLESKNELYFKDFYQVNIDLVCAAIGIPREVAMSIYDSNFSASRAALKDWEHTINVNRQELQEQFYQPIYNLWLDVEVLKNKISAPGYLEARVSNNYYVLEAFRNARFIGVGVPHIDPVKEVTAERMKLGEAGKHLPLTTAERATENLNGGEFKVNLANYKKELEESKDILPVESSSNESEETQTE